MKMRNAPTRAIYNLVAAEREQLVKEGERNRDLRYIIDMKRLLKIVKLS